jgi:hypothetical protein
MSVRKVPEAMYSMALRIMLIGDEQELPGLMRGQPLFLSSELQLFHDGCGHEDKPALACSSHEFLGRTPSGSRDARPGQMSFQAGGQFRAQRHAQARAGRGVHAVLQDNEKLTICGE